MPARLLRFQPLLIAGLCSLLFPGLLFAAPAQAQVLVPKNVVATEYARCAARRDLAAARVVVLAGLMSAEATDAFERLIHESDSCLRNYHLSARRHVLRGAIAEYLLERDAAVVAGLANRPITPVTPMQPVEADRFGDALARCVALAEPRRAVAVMSTEINSQPERETMFALKPAVDACLPPAGAQRMTIADLRSYLAAVLYQLAEPTTPSAAGDR